MKIAYLTTCFGTRSHTFIRREIRALRAMGLDIILVGIRRDDGNIAQDAADLVAETHYLYPFNRSSILRSNIKALTQSPLHYLRGLWSSLASPEFGVQRRLKMLYHFLASAPTAESLRANGVTHVHAHFLNVSSSVAMFAAHHAKLPFSVTVHSAGTFRTASDVGIHQKLQAAQFLLMISAYNVEYFDAITPCRDKSHVVRCGMDLQGFDYRAPATYETGSPPKILAVGRFVEKKGFRYLIEAAQVLRNRGIEFQLEIIGGGPLETELHQQVQTLGLEDTINFAGQQSTHYVRNAMAGSDIVVVPSVTSQSGEMEGLPVVIMEAMASGVFVIASAHSGIPEIVADGTTGYLTPEKDVDALALAVERVLTAPDTAILGRARELIENTFNIDVVAQQRYSLFKHYHLGT